MIDEIGGKSSHGGDMDSEIGNVEAGSGDQVGTCAAYPSREALLKQVAECAPKEWGARCWVDYVHFAHIEGNGLTSDEEQRCVSLNLRTDSGPDAEAIILMLDEMEEAGYLVSVLSPRDFTDHDGEYCVTLVAPIGSGKHPKEWMGVQGTHAAFGKTRADAIAKAFVAVFGKASQNGCGKEPPASTPIPESPSPTVEEKS